MEEEEKFVDAESYRGSQQYPITYPDIVLQHFKKTIALRSEEMRGGFYLLTTKTTKTGTSEIQSWVPDTRERFGGAVDSLSFALISHFDKQMKKVNEEIKKELGRIKKECLDQTSIEEKEILSSEQYEGKDKRIVEEYRFLKLRLKEKLFMELSLLLQRKNYLQGIELGGK